MRGAGVHLHHEICIAAPSPWCNNVGKKLPFHLRPRHLHGIAINIWRRGWLHRPFVAGRAMDPGASNRRLMARGKVRDTFYRHDSNPITPTDDTGSRPQSFQAVFDANLNNEPPELSQVAGDRHRGKDFAILADLMSAQARNSRALLDELKSAPLEKEHHRAYDDVMPSVTKEMGSKRRSAAPKSFKMAGDNNRRKSTFTSTQKSAKSSTTKIESEIAGFKRSSPAPFGDRRVKKDSASLRSESPTEVMPPLQKSSSKAAIRHREQSANRPEELEANRHVGVTIVEGHTLQKSFLQSSMTPQVLVGEEKHGHEMATANGHDKSTASLHDSSLHAHKSSEKHGSGNSEEKLPLRGQEILLALQRAALEKAKRKQTSAKALGRVNRVKQSNLPQIEVDWQNARPIAIKADWASQIEDLERRIKELKENFPT